MERNEGREAVSIVTHTAFPLRYWRNWWGLKCKLQWCGGMVDHDRKGVHWLCSDCGKVTRV
jgi:hypothetical protein